MLLIGSRSPKHHAWTATLRTRGIPSTSPSDTATPDPLGQQLWLATRSLARVIPITGSQHIIKGRFSIRCCEHMAVYKRLQSCALGRVAAH
jgi:hypothetical protein